MTQDILVRLGVAVGGSALGVASLVSARNDSTAGRRWCALGNTTLGVSIFMVVVTAVVQLCSA